MELNGVDLEQLKTIASLAQLDQAERGRQVEKAARDVRELRDMIQPAEYLACLEGLASGERDEQIQAANKILEVLGEQIPAD